MGINYAYGGRSYNKALYTYSVTLLRVAIVTVGVILKNNPTTSTSPITHHHSGRTVNVLKEDNNMKV